MPLGKGYSVEEQLTGKSEVGDVQFNIFKRLDDRFEVLVTREGREHVIPPRYLVNTPAEISLEKEQPVKLRLRWVLLLDLKYETIYLLTYSFTATVGAPSTRFTAQSLAFSKRKAYPGSIRPLSSCSHQVIRRLKTSTPCRWAYTCSSRL